MQYFRTKQNPLLKKAIAAALIPSLVSINSFAQETVPNTYIDLPAPQLTGWNASNVLTLDNVQDVDGVTSATSFIYKSTADKDAAEAVDLENESIHEVAKNNVGRIYWGLDNGSGRAPGVQVVTDDFDFPTNNCIMASGELENEDLGVVLPKTCSDLKYSSKRYKFEIVEPDTPVDLAFDLGSKDIRYKGIKNPELDGGAELAEFRANTDIGRIYRVIQKIINNTDERIASFTFEIGTGIGDGFQPLNYEEHGVSFELRTLVPRAFFEGETGAPDIEVWDPMTFATFSPKMFNNGDKKGLYGFLDHEVAGFMPPQFPAEGVEKSSVIDSGTTIVNGVIGSMSPNYFDVEKNYSATTGEGINVPALGRMKLGYMLPDSLLPTVIGEYSTNVVGGESDSIVAFWDGDNWRYGRAGADGDPETTPDNFTIIPFPADDPNSPLVQWATKLLGYESPGLPRYESLLSDDLSGLNTDMFIHINEKIFDHAEIQTITLRVTANSVEKVIGEVSGAESPNWMEDDGNGGLVSNAPNLAEYLPAADGTPIPFNDASTTQENLTKVINVLGNDLIKSGTKVISITDPSVTGAVVVAIEDAPVKGTAVVYNLDPSNPLYDAELVNTIIYTGDLNEIGDDTFTYSVTVDGNKSDNNAKVVITIEAKPIPDAPVANNDSAVTFETESVAIDVLANDSLNKGTPVSVVINIDNPPLIGEAVVTADNMIMYTAKDLSAYPEDSPIERFTYSVSVDNKPSNSALVTIRVDEIVSTEQYMKSSSSGYASGFLLLAIAGLLRSRRRYTFNK